MANDKDTLKRLDDVIEQSWNHLTPGTPDYAYVQNFKHQLREAILPPAEPLPTKKPD